jgi:MFS family permease
MQLPRKLTNWLNLRRFEPGIWAAAGIQAIRVTGYSISFTYLPLYLYQQRHISMTLVGVIILISGILSAVFQVVGGILADRFGHRRMFIVYQLTELVTFALLAVLIGINAPVWSIIVVAILVPTVGGMSSPTVSAMVADISPGNRMTESYGLLAIGGNLGWAIGPLTGGYLLSVTSYAWIFASGALICSLSLFGIPFLPRGSVERITERFSFNNFKSFISNRHIITFCTLYMLFALSMAGWGGTLSVFTVDRIGFSPEQYGFLMTISGVLIIIFQYPISRRIEWLGTRKALFWGSFLYGAGFLSLAWVRTFIPAVGSIIILVAGEMLFVPTSLAVVGKISKPEDRGKNMGFLGLSGSLGNSLGPLLGGFLLDRFPTNPFYLWGPISLPSFIAAVGFLLWRGYSRTEVTDDLDTKQQRVTK